MTNLKEMFSNWGVSAVDILVPIGILFVGWMAAIIISKVVRGVLQRTSIDERLGRLVLGDTSGSSFDSSRIISKIVFWVVMLFVVLAFLARLQLSFAAEPISAFLAGIFAFAPKILGALALAICAWIVAKIVKRLVAGALSKTSFDRRLAEEAGPSETRPSTAIAEAAHWLVYLLFLPAILGVLELTGILRPIEGMLHKFLGFLPNLLSAAIIFVAGWFVAKIVQKVVSSGLVALGADRASQRLGIEQALGSTKLSTLIGMIVHVLIIIPVAIAGLGALKIDAITAPASRMLSTLLNAIPNVFGAAIILGISFIVGKFISGLVTNILSSAGFDRVLLRLGLAKAEPTPGSLSPSKLVGTLIMVSIMLFASVEAANILGFSVLGDLVSRLMVRAGQVILGVIIFGAGLLLGEFVAKAIRGTNMSQANILATAAKVSITALAIAMGLGEMNISGSIVPLTFGLTLGAVAVAVALAFGLGAREQAGEIVRNWRMKWRSQK